ncbi:MAG: hypothetical protein AAF378_24385 [Cyanobacteria bacterium P01_A01_bin.84]
MWWWKIKALKKGKPKITINGEIGIGTGDREKELLEEFINVEFNYKYSFKKFFSKDKLEIMLAIIAIIVSIVGLIIQHN